MKNLGNLSPQVGSHRSKKRKGRGIGSGLGKTAGRGHKGQKARKSPDVGHGFEGGQTPMYRRLPKFGFQNAHNNVVVELVSLKALNKFEGTVDRPALEKAGLVKRKGSVVKILANGTLSKKLHVKVDRISSAAEKAIVAQGGKVEKIEVAKK